MPFAVQKETCRRVVEQALRQYARIAEEVYLDKDFCFETMVAMKKAAKFLCYARKAYYVASALDAGTELDLHGDDHPSTHGTLLDHGLPASIKPQVGARPAAPA